MTTDAEGQTAIALERDRAIVAKCLNDIMATIGAWRWATEGRGPYEWDDDDYRKEFGNALDAIERAARPLSLVASDLTDCPLFPADISDARAKSTGRLKGFVHNGA